MLNINKIHSDINFRNLQKTDVTEILGIPYTTTIDRLKKGNWTPDDIEKFAKYFGRSISYYFDQEEIVVDPLMEEVNSLIKDSPMKLNLPLISKEEKQCQECMQKDIIIKDLRENIIDLRKHIDLLESLVEKKDQQKASG